MDLVIASSNSTKVRELRKVLQEILPHVTIRSLVDFPEFTLPPTHGSTFEENALQKATAAATALQKPCLADDSGLVIPYLGGREDSLRRKALQSPLHKLPDTKVLLRELQAVDEVNRVAFLECALAFATPEKSKMVSSRIEGSIALVERGPASFDFSSIFIKHDYRKTLAELPTVFEKISHRRKACERLALYLKKFYVS